MGERLRGAGMHTGVDGSAPVWAVDAAPRGVPPVGEVMIRSLRPAPERGKPEHGTKVRRRKRGANGSRPTHSVVDL